MGTEDVSTMEYYSAIKRDEIGSFVVLWSEPRTLSYRVKQVRKASYHMIMYIHGIWKNVTDEPLCREGVEMQV